MSLCKKCIALKTAVAWNLEVMIAELRAEEQNAFAIDFKTGEAV